MALPVNMISSHGVIPTSEYAETLREKYSFQMEDGILIPLDEASFLEPPPGKFRPVALRDSLPHPSRKYAQGFTTPAVSVPSHSIPTGEMPSPGNLYVAPLVVLPTPVLSESLESVEDNKKGILAGATSCVTRKRGLMSLATLSDVAKRRTIADRCRRCKLATNFIATMIPSSEEAINILDDDTH
ncbi:unnamed protein product [Lactuca virosa]|uniref:Uncharacterized protein n=1 Tax=Lactuca virosa TaxID=75947 RepID=A0AAU9MP78_9ASTR|nr:unnamed protein product [Lactuca virosa]